MKKAIKKAISFCLVVVMCIIPAYAAKTRKSGICGMYCYDYSVMLYGLEYSRGWNHNLFYKRNFVWNGDVYYRRDSGYQREAYADAIAASVEQLQNAGYDIDTAEAVVWGELSTEVSEDAYSNALSSAAAGHVGEDDRWLAEGGSSTLNFVKDCLIESGYLSQDEASEIDSLSKLKNKLTRKYKCDSYSAAKAKPFGGKKTVSPGDICFIKDSDGNYLYAAIITSVDKNNNYIEIAQCGIGVEEASVGCVVTYRYSSEFTGEIVSTQKMGTQ